MATKLKPKLTPANPLRLARLQRGLTTLQCSQAVGMDESSYSRIERGRGRPLGVNARLIFDLFDGTVGWDVIFNVPSTQVARAALKRKLAK